ncbi:hypothetical protein CHUAL_002868 [Chamberlinius hualienensis]
MRNHRDAGEDLPIRNSELFQKDGGLNSKSHAGIFQKESPKADDCTTMTLSERKMAGVHCYQCNFCSKEFKKPSDLNRHLRVHTKEKPFKCDQCDRSFAVKCTLISHQRTHSGVKAFSCDICGLVFTTQGCLNVHKRLHTGIKPFDCPHCDKKFRASGNLKKHLRYHLKEQTSTTADKSRSKGKKQLFTTDESLNRKKVDQLFTEKSNLFNQVSGLTREQKEQLSKKVIVVVKRLTKY